MSDTKSTGKACFKQQGIADCCTTCPLCVYISTEEAIRYAKHGRIVPDENAKLAHFIIYCGCEPIRIEEAKNDH